MKDFDFHRPQSVAEAVETLRGAPGAKLLGGGQSLLPAMKLDLAAPADLVSTGALAELKGIARDGDALTIGAGETHDAVHGSKVVRETIPALAELAGHIGDPQVRNRGTLGGSIAHNDPAADYPAALLALGATVVTDRREIPAADFFLELFGTPLEADEVIVKVRIPIPRRAAYAKFPNPASRFAIVGVVVADTADGPRVAVTGAASGVFRASGMESALAADFSPAALDGVTVDPSDLMEDPDASAEYRAHLVAVMAKRAVAACA
ncbi:MAG: FAD binding domain-containing protein [Gemmatimonadota bacterium]